MKKDLQEQISDLVKKELPAHVSTELQKVLKQAEADAKRVVDLEATLKRRDERIKYFDGEQSKYQKTEKREMELNRREAGLDKRELELNNEILKIRLEESEKRADMVMGYTGTLVKNTTFRRNVMRTNSEDLLDPQNPYYNTGQMKNSSSSSQETITED